MKLLLLMSAFLSLNQIFAMEDYSHFYGRVTDVSEDGKILRVNTENKNIKLKTNK